jgi:hypothetical protein
MTDNQRVDWGTFLLLSGEDELSRCVMHLVICTWLQGMSSASALSGCQAAAKLMTSEVAARASNIHVGAVFVRFLLCQLPLKFQLLLPALCLQHSRARLLVWRAALAEMPLVY